MKMTFAHTCSLRLLQLYPRAWRERYADEAAAVLEERPATVRTLFDLLLGMLDAYLHAELFTERNFVMLQRLRNSQINIFISLVFFSLFWAMYSLTTQIYHLGVPSWDFTSPAPNYTFVFPLVLNMGLFAIVATLLGGGAFIVVALKQACAKNAQNIPPVVCTLISVFAIAQFFGLIILVELFHQGAEVLGLSLFSGAALFFFFTLLANLLRLRQGIRNGRLSLRFLFPTLVPGLSITAITCLFYLPFIPRLSFYFSSRLHQIILFIIFVLILVGILGSSLIYLVRQLRQVEFSPRFLRFTFFLASLITLTMLVTLGLLLYEAQIIYLHVNTDGLKLLSVSLLRVIVICTALPTAFSCFSFWRGLTAMREGALA